MFLDQSAASGVGSCYRNMAAPSGTIWMEWGKGPGMDPRKGVRVTSPSAPQALSGRWRCSSEHRNVPALGAPKALDRHCPEITRPRGRVQILPRGSCPGTLHTAASGPSTLSPHLGQHPRAELEFQSRDRGRDSRAPRRKGPRTRVGEGRVYRENSFSVLRGPDGERGSAAGVCPAPSGTRGPGGRRAVCTAFSSQRHPLPASRGGGG